MKRGLWAALPLIAALAGCGGGTDVRFYRGTRTWTETSGGSTNVTTVMGSAVPVIKSGVNPKQVLIFVEEREVTAELDGNTLTFVTGQDVSNAYASGTSSSTTTLSVSNGTGSLTDDQLQFNVSVSGTSMTSGFSSSVNVTITFNGTRE